MMKRITIALALFGIAGPLLAQQPVATSVAPPLPGKAAAQPERQICKRSAPSGSMIETRRECHTRAEWNQIAQTGRAQGQDMVDRAAATGQ